MKEPRKIPLTELLKVERKDTIEIWVMNRTAERRKRPGAAAITVNEDGERKSVIVPNTWIPYCITNEISAEVLLKSADFRRSVNGGMISIHDSEECVEFISKELGAKDEQARIQDYDQGLEDAITGEFGKMKNDEVQTAVSGSKEVPEGMEGRVLDDEMAASIGDLRSIGVLTLVVNVLRDEEMDDAGKMNSLRVNKSKLNKKDLEYIKATSTNPTIQKWADSTLESLTGKPE